MQGEERACLDSHSFRICRKSISLSFFGFYPATDCRKTNYAGIFAQKAFLKSITKSQQVTIFLKRLLVGLLLCKILQSSSEQQYT